MSKRYISDGGSSIFRGGGRAMIDKSTFIEQVLFLIILKSEGVPPLAGSAGPVPIDLSVNNLDYRFLPARIISFFFLSLGA